MKLDRKIHGAVVLMALLLSAPLGGNEWHIREFLTPQGVSFPEVRDVLEDNEGRVWFATWGGGVLWTRGTEWKVYDETTGFLDNWVRCLELDDEGAVWIGTSDGLCRVRGDEVETFTSDRVEQFPDDGIYDIERVADGTLWISLRDLRRIVAYRKPTADRPSAWEIVADEGILPDRVRKIFQATDGRIWIALRRNGVLYYDGKRWHETLYEDGTQLALRGFCQTRDGTLWAATERGVAVLREDTWRAAEIQFAGLARTIAESPEGALFVAGSSAIHIQDGPSWRPIDVGRPMYAQKFLFSKDGLAFWVGTRSGLLRGIRLGWSRFSRTASGSELLPETLSASGWSSAVCADSAGRLVRFQGDAWTVLARISDDEFGPRRLLPASDDTIWALSLSHFVEISLPSGEIRRKIALPSELSGTDADLFRTGGGELWLLSELGVYALRDASWSLLGPPVEQIIRGVGGVAEAADGSFWVCFRSEDAGTGRVEHWIDGRVELLEKRYPILKGKEYQAACCRRDGSVWFGTDHAGLLAYDGDSVRQLTVDDGLASNLISAIHEASDGTLWVVYNRKGLGSYRDGRWVHHRSRDGVPGWEIDRIVEDRQGGLWISAADAKPWLRPENRGVYLYTPDREPPETTIDAYPEGGVAPHGIGVFSFSGVDAWAQTERADLVYSWRTVPASLTDEEASWSPFTTSTSVITDAPALSPGDYVFEVRAADSERNVDPTPARVRVTVFAPLWARAEVLVPVSLLVAIALLALSLLIRKHRSLGQTQMVLRRSEETHRLLFQSASDGIATIRNYRIVDCNRRMTEILGRPRSQIIGRPPWEHSPPCQPDGRRSSEAARALIEKARRDESLLFEWEHVRGDGSTVEVEVSLNRVDIEDGPTLLALVRDISSRKQSEERLAVYQEQLRALAGQLAMAEEEERRRIATGLHDRTAQDLAAALLLLGAVQAEASCAETRRAVEEVVTLISRTGEDLRSLSLDLSPPVLYEVGLDAALEALTARFEATHGIRCTFEGDEHRKPLERSARALLYRCTSELLANVAKHAAASSTRISARSNGKRIEVTVRDDGKGFDTERLQGLAGRRDRFGLFSIRERLHAVQGTLEIDSGPGRGTRIVLSVPVEADATRVGPRKARVGASTDRN